MFDWDDSELSNILWDEAADNGDHIVPYPKGSEDRRNKEWKEESDVVEANEKDETCVKLDLNEKNPENSSGLVNSDRISASGMGMEPWPDLPLSNDSTAERKVNAAQVSNNLSEITNYDSDRGRNQLGKETVTYQSNHEGKEQGDFVDYGWANIGSFDDLDRIFSNNDGVFGHSSLGNADGMWSSSRDVDNSTLKSFPISSDFQSLGPRTLRNRSQNLEVKTKYVHNDDLSCSLSYGETDNSTSPSLQSGHGNLNRVDDAVGESKPMEKDQTCVATMGSRTIAAAQNIATVGMKKKPTRSRKTTVEKIHGKQSQESYGSWSSSISPLVQHENRMALPMSQHFPSPVHHMQFPGNELFPYQHFTNQFAARPVYGNLSNPYYQPIPAMPPHIQPGKFKHQQLVPNYDGNPVNKPSPAPVKPVTMTPQEKIEKLRRRQQLQAMLAIEKQQQRLSQRVSSAAIQSRPRKLQRVVDPEFDDLSTFSSLETNSPREQDDSGAISANIEDCSREEIILHRLQDMIKNLDTTVGLSIRDSLFRLARSAMQRQNATDTSSSNKISKDEHETLSKEEIGSYPRLEDGETETNPIDRTVAHLLFFQRPFELPGKHSEPSESPRSIVNVPETLTNQPLVEPDQFKDEARVDISENALTSGLTDDRGTVSAVAVESSQ